MQSNPRPVWSFPTDDPSSALACDYNELAKHYNLNCRKIRKEDVHPNVRLTAPRAGGAPGPGLPPVWYFPTDDPDWVVACDYNAREQQYNLNCRRMRLADIPNLADAFGPG